MAADGPDPDRELIEAARDGQVRAMEVLLDRNQARVLRVLLLLGVPAQDREDVAQEVFVRVFRHLKGFRPDRSFAAWLYRVTVNATHDYRTRRWRHGLDEAPWSEGLDVSDLRPGPAEAIGRRELKRALARALDLLSERERAVFVLKELEGLASLEVARVLGITSITVRRHLGRARRRLRSALAGGGEQENAAPIERLATEPGSHE